MQHLLNFTKFLADRRFALDDIEEFKELIEPISDPEHGLGYRLKAMGPSDRIRQRCQVLIFYTWHCRDYVKKILLEKDPTINPGQIVNARINQSFHAQIVNFLANAYKHDGADQVKHQWTLDQQPRLGKPYRKGQQVQFPGRLKPTVIQWGETLGELEFTGRAGIGDFETDFGGWQWHISCTIENKDGKELGDAVSFCETTFAHWFSILADNGIPVPTQQTA